MSETKTRQGEITAAERKLLELAKEIDFGQLLVTVKNGEPVHVEEIRKSIRLK